MEFKSSLLECLDGEVPPKLHIFGLTPPLLVSVIESLPFEDIVRLVDNIMLSNKKGRSMWHAQIKGMMRCLDNRRYTHESLRWVLKREIPIRNFTTRRGLREGETELHFACEKGRAWIARACIALNDNDINAPCGCNVTPLHTAVAFGHIDVVELLLESGAESCLYRKNGIGSLPIIIALNNERFDTAKLLLQYHGKDKEMALENLGQAFCRAAVHQNLEIVKIILEICGPKIVHSRNSDGSTALHESCFYSDNTEVMDFLLASGAGVNAVDDDGWTPLHNSV